MLLTESEARCQWCPFARVTHTLRSPSDPEFIAAAVAVNRGHADAGSTQIVNGAELLPDNGRCIASECAAWRWWHRVVRVPASDGATIVSEPAHAGPRGFCGLAGKPISEA